MEQFYKRSHILSSHAQKLTEELFKFNPSFVGDNNKKSLPFLAGMARELEEDYNQLRKDLIKRHEK